MSLHCARSVFKVRDVFCSGGRVECQASNQTDVARSPQCGPATDGVTGYATKSALEKAIGKALSSAHRQLIYAQAPCAFAPLHPCLQICYENTARIKRPAPPAAMIVPGFSVTDIIIAVDKAAKLIKLLKDAPTALENVIKGIEFGRAVLKSWKRQIEENPEDIHKDDLDLLVHIKAEYDSIIQELENFTERHRKVLKGDLGARFNWVTSEHFRQEGAGLEIRLREVEGRSRTVLQTLSWGTSREVLRRTNSSVQQRIESPTAPQTYHSPELLPQAGGSSIPQTLSEQAKQLPFVSNNCGTSQYSPLPSPGLSTISSGHSDQSGVSWNSTFNISDSLRQGGSNQAVQTSPNFGHVPSQSSSLGYGVERDIVFIHGANASPVGTESFPPSIFSSTSTRSSGPTEYSPLATIQLPISPIAPHQQPDNPYCKNTTSSVSFRRDRPPSSETSSSPATVLASQDLAPLSRPLPPPTIERMPIKGEIRIWYPSGQPDQILRDLDVARSSGKGASEVQMTTHRGIAIVHRGCANRTVIAKTILPLRRRDFISRAGKVDARIKYVIRLIGRHELYKRDEGNILFTGSPEYSFTDRQDYEKFQTMITGKINLLNVEIRTISASGDDAISDSQVLQVWNNNNTRTIRFFRNVIDGEFSEYETAGLKQYYSKKNELKLEFKSGHDKDYFKKLKIVFLTESERDEFVQLAQFSSG